MDKTPNLQLSLMANKQGQRATYHDNALKDLDTLVMLSVIDRDHSSPPVSAVDGDRYLVKTPGSGDPAWVTNNVVVYMDGGWRPYPPCMGWTCYVQHEGALLAWNGSSWLPALDVMGSGTALQNLGLLGIATTADATNPLAAKLNNTLWTATTVAEGGDGNLRYKLSKESAAKTLSLLFQDNYSGRAEIGLTGDDDFHFKVSADGSSWLEAIVIDRTTGKLTFGQGFSDPAATRAKTYAAPFDSLAYNGMQINGGVDVSQELGTTGASLTSATAKYIADGWQAQYVHGAGTAVVTSAQIAAASFPAALPGYAFGHQLKVTTAITSPANGDYALHRHLIEGYRVARLGFGATGAQPVSYGFNFYSTLSGTIFVKLSNSDKSRCCYKEHTVVAGWNFFTGTVAGDTSGTWQKTTAAGLIFEVFSAGKAASPVAPGSWTATNTTQTTNSTNLLGTNNNLTIVTGLVVLPGTEVPTSAGASLLVRPFNEGLQQCERYLKLIGFDGVVPVEGATGFQGVGAAITTGVMGLTIPLPQQMRTIPAVTFYRGLNGATNGKWAWFNSVWIDATSTAVNVASSGFLNVFVGSSSAFTFGQSYVTQGGAKLDARL